MVSLLRQLVAGPRQQHEDTGLDLCYVTSNIIATSGPSQTYPQLAYRNPLNRLVSFLDEKHGDGWSIWEFRAEGTGYPDEAVYNRIRHYPWPDHHPPPFRLVPLITASMRDWLDGEDGGSSGDSRDTNTADRNKHDLDRPRQKGERVVVVHCKAGKGRSGTSICSYLISECGWTAADALARFTERRMRPNFGKGVSIPSQLRYVGYVERWAHAGSEPAKRKIYVDRPIEIVEIHVWGLRHGVKLAVEGFADEGKRIETLHTFGKDERIVVKGDAPGGGGVMDMFYDMAGYGAGRESDLEEEEEHKKEVSGLDGAKSDVDDDVTDRSTTDASSARRSRSKEKVDKMGSTASNLMRKISRQKPVLADESEPGGRAVIFKPKKPIIVPNSDINIDIERRSRASASMGLTMVTAVGHVWFNAFFEGNGPEQDGQADDSGVFEIEWDELDGIKGSSKKGTRALDRLSVVWKVAGTGTGTRVTVITQPGEGSPVPQMKPADWKGANPEQLPKEKGLGLRAETTESASVSKASSLLDVDVTEGDNKDDESLAGVKTSDPKGEELDEVATPKASA
ncbi:hypothetical protein NEUTE1DRAFT_61384 [Neurospora tetrasperma FGSC 2508]|uniref:phosphatidylinositol-3,4,5-trisphosphate 3-phosphatase n=1 Tax=Neurospora tetrasperma (strain FGSC 2508 / ATCC MYA-4615 / P0657) TaxID=510951 RepID=F8MI13_NEUT8|nr:uncharacterized protein NEUTE1DRAFT_61384 [Neurospora tetrasperma FGSC 2508]EGO59721.1 hypothetical protein NEUTE1DRAFT_61384 [Neurospora tetrasperma FGSC 2508]EGZ73861.1 hypothetical protein NEUTE2DRAFT_87503 [Neurospora tetrasperma FGSC 2509]